MLTLASLLAAMTIAGAFWVGILAARRLRDWGDGRRQLSEGDGHGPPLALAAASASTNAGTLHDPVSRKIRERVAQRLQGRIGPSPSRAPSTTDPDAPTSASPACARATSSPSRAADPQHRRRLPRRRRRQPPRGRHRHRRRRHDRRRPHPLAHRLQPDQDRYLLCEPVRGHGLSGEPPRHILHDDQDYALERRGQSSAAGVGMHGRPALPRVATYLYRAGDHALWLERWGDQVLMGAATAVSAHDVHFLPGS
jgi:hypothetical protein